MDRSLETYIDCYLSTEDSLQLHMLYVQISPFESWSFGIDRYLETFIFKQGTAIYLLKIVYTCIDFTFQKLFL